MRIKVFTSHVPKEELLMLAEESYGDMVKGVVDIRKKILALGGELHADAEEVLLDEGCRQEDLWGFNIFVERPKSECIEYTSLINIRPKQGNRDREVKDPHVRSQIKAIIDAIVEL